MAAPSPNQLGSIWFLLRASISPAHEMLRPREGLRRAMRYDFMVYRRSAGGGVPMLHKIAALISGMHSTSDEGLAVSRLSVLISGAGIAGSALAYWVARFGHSATVVERSESLRSSGAPVDVRRPAMPIVERMNIVPRLREASTVVSGWTLLDEAGERAAHVDLGTLWGVWDRDRSTRRGPSANLHELRRGCTAAPF